MFNKKIKIEISARHVHLTKVYIEKLFGKKYTLKKLKVLSQLGEFAARETIDLKVGKNIIKKIRVIGPARDYTQVEISKTDSYKLKINPPIKMSGDLKKTVGGVLIGPKGKIKLAKGIILAHRHIHCDPVEAKKLKLKHGQLVKVIVKGERGLVFNKVKVKTMSGYSWSMHVDTDEANAAGIDGKNNTGQVII